MMIIIIIAAMILLQQQNSTTNFLGKYVTPTFLNYYDATPKIV